MKNSSITILLAALFVCLSQGASAEAIASEPIEIVAISSDSQFFLLKDDTAWFVFTEQQPTLSELAAFSEELGVFKVGDLVSVEKDPDQPFFTLTHDSTSTELVALKVDAIVRSPVMNKPMDGVLNLRNGLLIRCSFDLFDGVSKGSWITAAFLNQEFTFNEKVYHFDLQWSSSSYRNWLFQKVPVDSIKGSVSELGGALENLADPQTITSVSVDKKTLVLGDGTTYVNAEFSGKDDEGNDYIQRWDVGDRVEIGDVEDRIVTLTDLITGNDMKFLKPTLSAQSKVLETSVVTSSCQRRYIWVELENGILVEMTSEREPYFATSDLVTYTFLGTNYVPQKAITATVVYYHNLFNEDNMYDFCSDKALYVGPFSNFSKSTSCGATRLHPPTAQSQ